MEVNPMKNFVKGLAVLNVCGALNFGLTTEAQAADVTLNNPNDAKYSQIQRTSHRYRDDYGMPPPPDYGR